jgi:hypothetical protein
MNYELKKKMLGYDSKQICPEKEENAKSKEVNYINLEITLFTCSNHCCFRIMPIVDPLPFEISKGEGSRLGRIIPLLNPVSTPALALAPSRPTVRPW